MKDFFKYVGATVVGLIAFTIIAGLIGIMSIVGMIASGEAAKTVSDNSVLVLNLSGQMQERTEDNLFEQFTGGVLGGLGLEQTLAAVQKAKDNERIKGIYIEAGALGASYAQLQELRDALQDFRRSGKWIVAYGDIYTQGAYYVASAANKIYLNPQGMIDWHGIGAQPIFLKDVMAKFGVRMQVLKVGKYKSATETFTDDKMSDPNRAQTQAYINGLWQNVLKAVSDSRKISVGQLNQYADQMVTFGDPKDFVKAKFVDALLYADQVKAEVKKMLKLNEDESISQLSIADMGNVKEKSNKGEAIAVYYAYGDIVDSPMTGGLFGTDHQIVATEVTKDLERLMNDEDIKAVVIRVNSGGGSAYASEQIWHQIEMLKQKKPVVISMGGMAASGGYYMSCNSNWIVAEPTTLTGSIGIFGMFPDMSQLLTQKLGVKFDEVKTNRNATFGTTARPMNEEEMSYLRAYIDRGYSLFRKRVADGRRMTTDQVEALAQGHVYLGQDALKIKLVDQLGGLDAAITKAAQIAKLKEYYTISYPEQKDFLAQFMEASNRGNNLDEQMRNAFGIYYEPFYLLKQMNQLNPIQARIPFIINVK
ncbi:MAG: signal peptide peptidase SppA [Prevotella sp.]|nr:signal peptide peptidase SppA [Prevotella sp.]MDY4037976.1 signal peptide peptidase SppA [Prevotella sp.]